PEAGPLDAMTATTPVSRDFTAVAETRHGIIQFLSHPESMAQSLHLYGEYLEPQIDMLRRVVRADDTIIEYGAGCGAHTLALAKLCGNLIAHEVDAVARRVLRQNLRANAIRNVTVLPGSASATTKGPTNPSSTSLA